MNDYLKVGAVILVFLFVAPLAGYNFLATNLTEMLEANDMDQSTSMANCEYFDGDLVWIVDKVGCTDFQDNFDCDLFARTAAGQLFTNFCEDMANSQYTCIDDTAVYCSNGIGGYY